MNADQKKAKGKSETAEPLLLNVASLDFYLLPDLRLSAFICG
jgi:hypothetical protein